MPVKVGPLVGALAIIAGCAGGAVVLLNVADDHEADRAATSTTTVPSAGVDRVPVEPPPVESTTTTAATTTTAEDEGVPVVLRGDGLGAFRFAAPPDEVIAGLTLRWGPPDGDSDWVPSAGSPFGFCPGTTVRGVSWQGFTVLFADGGTPWAPKGTRHFFSWLYTVADPARPAPDPGGNRPRLQAANGVSVGMTIEQLRRAFGEALELFDEAPRGPQFGAQTKEGGLIYGTVTSHEPGGVVTSIVGGGGCGD